MGPDLFNDLVNGARTLLEPYDALVGAVHDNHLKAAPTISTEYSDLLQGFVDADQAVTATQWADALDALRPALEKHLDELATRSWRGRGIPAPPADLRAQYVQDAVDQQLKSMSDIRKRLNRSIAGKDGTQTPAEFVARAEQSAASVIARSQDLLYDDFGQWASDQGYVTSKIWRNADPENTRHPQMNGPDGQGLEVPVDEPFIDPTTDEEISPRDPGGSQADYSGSNATIRYRLTSNGKVV